MIVVEYLCHGCSDGRWVEVPCDERWDDEDLRHWIEHCVQPALGRMHTFRNPECRSPRVDLKIPAPNGTTNLGSLPPPN